ncbi:DUF1735 domain-containing protein [Mangrovibacterium marinum]|uniref:DUF1735 domain-containing protein n=1 Tax=Mangrovibacterium marinum TaxID=1639118 RepID=UPI002A18B812|nr:DUF1735 domain-containing protein [Mangrovibacterium marinum]
MKVINESILLAIVLLGILLLPSCEREDPMAQEQYVKQVYMVNAYKDVAVFEVPYGDRPQEAYVSVALSGTLPSDNDVVVTLGRDDNAIPAYNDKYMRERPVLYQPLPDANLLIPSLSSTIEAGDVYAHVPFEVNTDGLHCDSLYALAFKIDEVSAFQKNPLDTILLLNIKLVNDYSGDFQLSARKFQVDPVITDRPDTVVLSKPSSISTTRVLTAVNDSTVRFFHETNGEIYSDYDSNEKYWDALIKYGITFTKKLDGTFKIQPWVLYDPDAPVRSVNVLAGQCTFDEEEGIFTFWYDYMEGSRRSRLQGSLSKL